MYSFGVLYRNSGHWDLTQEYGRAFRIRGEPGDVVVHDERIDSRPFPRESLRFKTVGAAMAFCCDQLMHE